MASARPHDLADRFCHVLAAGTLALSLLAPAAEAFQHRPVGGLGDLLAAVLDLPPSGRGLRAQEEGGGLSLGTVDFDLAGALRDRTVGAGWFGGTTGALEYFTAAGIRVSDASSPEEEDGEIPPVTVGPWAGTGLGWCPTPDLRLALEARWTPSEHALAGDTGPPCRFQAGASFGLRW